MRAELLLGDRDVPLSEWAESDGPPPLNDLTTLDLVHEQGPSLFGYTTGSACHVSEQLHAVAKRLAAGELALIGQALIGVPQSYWLVFYPGRGPVEVAAVHLKLDGPPTAAVGALATEPQIRALYRDAERALNAPSTVFEHRGTTLPREATTRALARLANRIDRAYARWSLAPDVTWY